MSRKPIMCRIGGRKVPVLVKVKGGYRPATMAEVRRAKRGRVLKRNPSGSRGASRHGGGHRYRPAVPGRLGEAQGGAVPGGPAAGAQPAAVQFCCSAARRTLDRYRSDDLSHTMWVGSERYARQLAGELNAIHAKSRAERRARWRPSARPAKAASPLTLCGVQPLRTWRKGRSLASGPHK